jgi:diguanylate cyclase (GGDEF)-like protein/PAS domain S-box-containing protein
MSEQSEQANHLRVLLVEDEPISADLMRRHFESEGFQVDLATDGLQALEMHARRPYRVVVSDWMMPSMDGLSLCRELREKSGTEVYFILCSGRALADGRRQAFDAGVDDFLAKPINRDELVPRMNAARRILNTEDNLKSQQTALESQSEVLNDMSDSLTAAARRFQGLFDGLPVACFMIDQENRIRDWNNSAESVFGIATDQAIGSRADELLTTESADPWPAARVRQIMETGSLGAFEWEYVRNLQKLMLTSNLITMAEEGHVKGAICASIDITERRTTERKLKEYAESLAVQADELQAANRQLTHLAITDGLTGLFNHRRFHDQLAQRMSEFEMSGVEFSLILLDIDHFKRVNDRLGHQEGDVVLRSFAKTLRESARESDAPFRYGGEEFAILLRNCRECGSIEAAERFCSIIRRQQWSHWPMTASFGVTTVSPGSTARSLVAEADRALYAAKARGRNCVVHWKSLDQNKVQEDLISA